MKALPWHIAVLAAFCLLLGACSQAAADTSMYAVGRAGDSPLLKFNVQTKTTTVLCPDVFCDHVWPECPLSMPRSYVMGGGGVYFSNLTEDFTADILFLDFDTQVYRRIASAQSATRLYYAGGRLYWWEMTLDAGEEREAIHLCCYDEASGEILCLTDEETGRRYLAGSEGGYTGYPVILAHDEKYLYFDMYPDYYRSTRDFEDYGPCPRSELPAGPILTDYGWLYNGDFYSLDRADNTLICESKDGKKRVIARQVSAFVMTEDAIWYQPALEPVLAGVSLFGREYYNESHGILRRLDLKRGEDELFFEDPALHLGGMRAAGDMLILSLLGSFADAHTGEEDYGELNRVLFIDPDSGEAVIAGPT